MQPKNLLEASLHVHFLASLTFAKLKQNKDLHEQISTILRSLECDRERSVALASHLLSSCYSHFLKIYCHSYILSECRDGADDSATAHTPKALVVAVKIIFCKSKV